MKQLKYLLWPFLLFFPQLAFAQDWSINTFAPPATDMSVAFLRQIFGHVGPALMGAEQTILGNLFGVFNAGLISIAGIFLVYTTVKSIMDTAHEGEAMGKKLSHWTAIRTALGVGVLIPKFSGYSFIQVFVMWSVIQGVGLADHAWNQSLNYLRAGGVIYQSPKDIDSTSTSAKADYTLITSGGTDGNVEVGNKDGYAEHAITDSSINSASIDVFRSLVCMNAIEKGINAQNQNNSKIMAANPSNYPAKGTREYRAYVTNNSTLVDLQPSYDNVNGIANFPGSDVTWYQYEESGRQKRIISQGYCGKYNYYRPLSPSDISHQYIESKGIGLKSMVLELEPKVNVLVNQAYNKTQDPNADVSAYNDTEDMAGLLTDSALNFQSSIYTSRLLVGQSGKSDSDKDEWNNIGKDEGEGWVMAGRYYYTLSSATHLGDLDPDYQITFEKGTDDMPPAINSETSPAKATRFQLINNDFNVPYASKNIMKMALTFGDGRIPRALGIASRLNDQLDKGATSIPSGWNKFLNVSNDKNLHSMKRAFQKRFYVAYKDQGDEEGNTSLAKSNHSDRMIYILNKHVNAILGDWFDVMIAGQTYGGELLPSNSIGKLAYLGFSMMDNATDIWGDIRKWLLGLGITFQILEGAAIVVSTVAGATGTVAGVGAGVATAAVGAAYGLHSIFQIIMNFVFMSLPLVIGITTPLFVTGIMLNVYVPMIPFLLFLFGVISWLIFVIEAMAAAPLVALGITHPEGHDLLGKSEQAVMLLLSVFIRPISMIIGLVAGIVLSYVAIELLNAGFGNFLLSFGKDYAGEVMDQISLVRTSTGDKGIHLVDTVKNMGIIMIYTFTVLAIVNQSFSLIYVIPEKILRWIGLSPDQSQAPQMLESVKGGVQPFADAGGRAGGEQTSSSKQALGQRYYDRSSKGQIEKKPDAGAKNL